jgi:hypothetical protein
MSSGVVVRIGLDLTNERDRVVYDYLLTLSPAERKFVLVDSLYKSITLQDSPLLISISNSLSALSSVLSQGSLSVDKSITMDSGCVSSVFEDHSDDDIDSELPSESTSCDLNPETKSRLSSLLKDSSI